jgi:2-polyprenyl-3-methyl-5-hydroxy-6-metoxy-1,4-benzoquinol methylase
MEDIVKILNLNEQQKVEYCIPLWLRDEQVKQSTKRIQGRIEKRYKDMDEPIAVVCFGSSLVDTWEEIKNFKYIISCSGSHKFLVDRGIIPTYHIEVDPRAHKVELIGQPQKETQYLIASTCHSKVFDLLEGFNVKLWHVFDNKEEGLRILPPGEWALTGGSSVGLRALTMAGFLGFKELHVFGMDGSEGTKGSKKHADFHPNQPQNHSLTNYEGVDYKTTSGMLECAKQTFHELNQMPGISVKFYGEGLVQHMAKNYIPNYKPVKETALAYRKPELISPEYIELNKKLHQDVLSYGVGGGKHAKMVLKLVEGLKNSLKRTDISVLDYGCGKGYLGKEIPFPIWEYDPAISGKDHTPKPADLVVCTDVLEHIEPDKLPHVLDDLRRCVKEIGYFVISTRLAGKKLADGRNAHLIVEKKDWWENQLKGFLNVGQIFHNEKTAELYVIVSPLSKQVKQKSKLVTN